jgi:CarD family transcriptional regulator
MYKKGDCIIHAAHGAGIMLGVKMMNVSGIKQRYYHIDLLGNGTALMVPVDSAAEISRCPLIDMAMVERIFRAEPTELNRDYRERQAYIAEKIRSGDPQQVVEAVRDLMWRKHTVHLSIEDTKLLTRAKHLLASILALQPGLTAKAASRRLEDFLRQVIEAWKASEMPVS